MWFNAKKSPGPSNNQNRWFVILAPELRNHPKVGSWNRDLLIFFNYGIYWVVPYEFSFPDQRAAKGGKESLWPRYNWPTLTLVSSIFWTKCRCHPANFRPIVLKLIESGLKYDMYHRFRSSDLRPKWRAGGRNWGAAEVIHVPSSTIPNSVTMARDLR